MWLCLLIIVPTNTHARSHVLQAAQSAESRQQQANLQNELHVKRVELEDTQHHLVDAQKQLRHVNVAVDVVGQYIVNTPTASPLRRRKGTGTGGDSSGHDFARPDATTPTVAQQHPRLAVAVNASSAIMATSGLGRTGSNATAATTLPASPARGASIHVDELTASPRARQQSQQLGKVFLDSLNSE